MEIFQKQKLQVDRPVIEKIISSLCTANPLNKAIEKDGPLSSAYERQRYFKEKCNVVEPIEYILDAKKYKTLQYVPHLRISANAAE